MVGELDAGLRRAAEVFVRGRPMTQEFELQLGCLVRKLSSLLRGQDPRASSPMSEPIAGERMRPDWYAVAMLAAHQPTAGRQRSETYEFDVDGCRFHLSVGEASPRARRGPGDRPAFQLRADLADFLAIATRTTPLSRADISRDARASQRWLDAFALPQAVPAGR